MRLKYIGVLLLAFSFILVTLFPGCRDNTPAAPEPTATDTPYYTPTITPTHTVSPTFTDTTSKTASPTFTSTASPTATATATQTPKWSLVASSGYGPGPHTHIDYFADWAGQSYFSCADGGWGGRTTVFYDAGSTWDNWGATALSNTYSAYTNVYGGGNIAFTAYYNPIAQMVEVKRSASGGTWTDYGDISALLTTGNSVLPKMTMFGNDMYIVTRENTSPSGMSVSTYNGTGSWTYLGARNFNSINTVEYDILVTSSVYVFAHEGTNGGKVYMYSGGWSDISPSGGVSGGMVSGVSITYGPRVAFSDNSQSGKLSVMEYSGSGTTWNYVGGSAGITPNSVEQTSIAVYEGTVYVAYVEASGDYLKAMKYKSGTWYDLPPVYLNITADNPSIFCRYGIVFLGFQNLGSNNIDAWMFQ